VGTGFGNQADPPFQYLGLFRNSDAHGNPFAVFRSTFTLAAAFRTIRRARSLSE
jgi:hypothetical protein